MKGQGRVSPTRHRQAYQIYGKCVHSSHSSSLRSLSLRYHNFLFHPPIFIHPLLHATHVKSRISSVTHVATADSCVWSINIIRYSCLHGMPSDRLLDLQPFLSIIHIIYHFPSCMNTFIEFGKEEILRCKEGQHFLMNGNFLMVWCVERMKLLRNN